MKVVDKALKKTYRFNCPICGSRLEAEEQELTDLGNKVSEFFCPVCKKRRYTNWGNIRNRIVYEGENNSK